LLWKGLKVDDFTEESYKPDKKKRAVVFVVIKRLIINKGCEYIISKIRVKKYKI
jgi:hypothetical protein